MQVEIKIDSSCIDPKVIILTASMTEDVSNIVKKLSENASQIISGYKDEKIEILEQKKLSQNLLFEVFDILFIDKTFRFITASSFVLNN